MEIVREVAKGDYWITTDKSKIDLQVVHDFLKNESYWAKNIPFKVVENSIRNSLTFSVFYRQSQVGFARVITDYSTFAYLADVFIISSFRKRNLSKWLMEFIKNFPELQGLRRWMLMTQDAHSLYEKYGFKVLAHPDRAMEITFPKIYS